MASSEASLPLVSPGTFPLYTTKEATLSAIRNCERHLLELKRHLNTFSSINALLRTHTQRRRIDLDPRPNLMRALLLTHSLVLLSPLLIRPGPSTGVYSRDEAYTRYRRGVLEGVESTGCG